MKVALVNPGKGRRWSVSEPLNLGYIAGYLERNEIEVKIIDQIAGQDVRKEIKNYNPDIVGITATTPLAPYAYKIADECKERGILTVIGGVHATAVPEDASSHADIVVMGEGEIAMLDIIKEGIKSGIISRPYVKNLDEIPPPARHLMKQDFYLRTKDRLGDVVSHLHFVPFHAKVASIISSRGCPYACVFCHNSLRKSPLRFHSAERTVFEIKHLIEMYGVDAIFFMDDNLLANKPRLKKICNLMKESKIDIIWGCNATSNHVDLDTLQMIKEVGCKQLVFGFESGSQRVLDYLGKHTTVEGNKKAARLCKEVGISVTVTFMVGNPTETIDDVRATQRFIEENKNYIDMYGVSITTPYPGTALWLWCKKRGLIPQSLDWSRFTQGDIQVLACDTIQPEEIERLYLETGSIKPFKLSRLWNRVWWHPRKTLGWVLRHPLVASKYVQGAIHSKFERKKD